MPVVSLIYCNHLEQAILSCFINRMLDVEQWFTQYSIHDSHVLVFTSCLASICWSRQWVKARMSSIFSLCFSSAWVRLEMTWGENNIIFCILWDVSVSIKYFLARQCCKKTTLSASQCHYNLKWALIRGPPTAVKLNQFSWQDIHYKAKCFWTLDHHTNYMAKSMWTTSFKLLKSSVSSEEYGSYYSIHTFLDNCVLPILRQQVWEGLLLFQLGCVPL